MPIKTIYLIVLFTVMALLSITGVNYALATLNSTVIHSPYPIVIKEKAELIKNQCDVPPSPPRELRYNSIYIDRDEGLSIVDPDAQTKYKKKIKNIELYEKNIQAEVNRLIAKQSLKSAYCAVEWLETWAKNDGMLTRDTNFQGEAVRKWFLATIASHYYILDQYVNIPDATKIIIEEWINKLAQIVIQDYSIHPKRNSRHNNHIYWAAWSVMIASAVLNNEEYFKWALKHARKGVREIQRNGVLPRELTRKRKAFTYHVFAAAPLIMIAETAKKNDINLYNQNNGSLHRLVSLIITELNYKQSALTALTGQKQDITNTITPYSLAWLEVYHSRFPSSRTKKWINKLAPMKSRRLGGNLSILFEGKTN